MWPAIIGAVASLGGALLGGRGQSQAANAQYKAQQEALAFEREREARRIQEYNEREAAKRAYLQQWNANRLGLLRRWGVPVGATLGTMGRPEVRASAEGQRMRLAPPQAQPGPTLANLDRWNEWGL